MVIYVRLAITCANISYIPAHPHTLTYIPRPPTHTHIYSMTTHTHSHIHVFHTHTPTHALSQPPVYGSQAVMVTQQWRTLLQSSLASESRSWTPSVVMQAVDMMLPGYVAHAGSVCLSLFIQQNGSSEMNSSLTCMMNSVCEFHVFTSQRE